MRPDWRFTILNIAAVVAMPPFLPAQEPKLPPDLKKVTVADGVALHYVEKGKGTPIIFIHGTGGEYSVWGGYLNGFADRYRAIAYSRRHNYPNENKIQPNYSAAVDAEDLAGLIKKLDLGKAHLVGHSYGAYTALFLAVKHPELVRSLTLAEPPVRFSGDRLDGARERIVKGLRAAKKGDAEGLIRAFGEGLSSESPDKKPKEIPEFYRKMVLRNAREFEADAASDDMFPGIDREAVRKLAVPTLLLSGENTIPFLKVSDAELERLLPEKRRRRIIFRDADHGMVYQKFDECRKAILEFLRDK
jgi:pimeloyl-ACP methyl ester carboxylesterase